MNVTRSFIAYEIKAYGIEEIDGEPTLKILAETSAIASSMTKGAARAALAEAAGHAMPSGCTVKWEPKVKLTYAMAQEEFIENSTVIKSEEL